MPVKFLNEAPWLPCDSVWKGKLGTFQFRVERWGKRITITPGIGVDWEQGFFTLQFFWLMFAVGLDIEYDPQWEESEEAKATTAGYPVD